MSMKYISVSDLNTMAAQGKDLVIIDVRTRAEFNRGHIPEALNLHGDALRQYLRSVPAESTIAVVCQSGGRSQLACEALRREFQGVVNVSGGTGTWIHAGLPIEKENEPVKPTSESNLRRQTHLVAGILLITALVMGFTGHPTWFYLACLPAFGLMLDAITGICPMTFVLRKAPWNSGAA
ncbi:MAG: rhodanese-like domain-containing protein [Armatimonadota bacterium]